MKHLYADGWVGPKNAKNDSSPKFVLSCLLYDEVEKRVSEKVLLHTTVTSGNPADEIARIAQDDKSELIVIASHGESGWRYFIHGSVTERVLRLAPCHVLVVRASHH